MIADINMTIRKEYSYWKFGMPELRAEVTAAQSSIRKMLNETPRPTQARIAAATGLTQSRVAKINRCDFRRMSEGVRRVVEYSSMTSDQRMIAEARIARVAARVSAGVGQLAARDPQLSDVVADFIDKLVRATTDGR